MTDATRSPGSILGNRVLRTEDPKLLTGAAKYLADLPLEVLGIKGCTVLLGSLRLDRVRSDAILPVENTPRSAAFHTRPVVRLSIAVSP